MVLSSDLLLLISPKQNIFRNCEKINFIIAIIINLYAIYVVGLKSRKEMGEYKKFLLSFLICDVLFTILHFLIEPIISYRETSFYFYGEGLIRDMRVVSFYAGVASMTFLLLAFHFIYRAIVVTSTTIFRLENVKLTSTLLFLLVTLECTIWTIVCVYCFSYTPILDKYLALFKSENLDTFPNDPTNELMVYVAYIDNKLNTTAALGVLMMITICAMSICIITGCCIVIVRTLRRSLLSDKGNKLHQQLFNALLVQLLIPCVLLYIPCTIVLTMPFFPPLHTKIPSWLVSFLYSMYPIVDPMVVLIFIEEYRKVTYRLFHKVLRMKTIPISSSITM